MHKVVRLRGPFTSATATTTHNAVPGHERAVGKDECSCWRDLGKHVRLDAANDDGALRDVRGKVSVAAPLLLHAADDARPAVRSDEVIAHDHGARGHKGPAAVAHNSDEVAGSQRQHRGGGRRCCW